MGNIAILGIFVADCAFYADRQPAMGETILSRSFALTPGGKGSNQSVAVARAGGNVRFMTRLGRDPFADIAAKLWAEAGVIPEVIEEAEGKTGAAFIFVDHATRDNAILVSPEAARNISMADVEHWEPVISRADVFMTQLEQPIEAVLAGLNIARSSGTLTILNPAPAAALDPAIWRLCDIVTPNEVEVAHLTGVEVRDAQDARRAADVLLSHGAGAVVVTLGSKGALYHDADTSEVIPAISCGPVVETTGAGDAFNGSFATAIAGGADRVSAVRAGCAAAGLSVTRPGAADSMPTSDEIAAVLASS